jgi:hypothetical protein
MSAASKNKPKRKKSKAKAKLTTKKSAKTTKAAKPAKGHAKPASRTAAAKPAGSAGRPAPAKGAPRSAPKGAVPIKAVTLLPVAAPARGAAKPARPQKRSTRKSALSQRRGPDGQLFVPGDLLLPGGPKDADELQYFFRGCAASEHAGLEPGVEEALAKRGGDAGSRPEIQKHAHAMTQRFDSGSIEPVLPTRSATARRTFQTVIDRAKHRRREIGAFMRGLDMGRTETSHMDSHGEASLQSLMEWAARLENLVEADEPEQADYMQFHRVLDQLDNTTEALIIDVELTLRRLRDRIRTH